MFGPEHWTTLAPMLLRAIGHESPLGTPSAAHPSYPDPAAVSAIRYRIAYLCSHRNSSAMHFVQSLFSALDWAVTEVSVCLRAVAARRPGAHASSSQKRRLLVYFSIAVTCAQLVEFLVENVPTLFLQGPPVLADRLAEMLAFLVVHAPVDSSSDDYKAITSAAGSVDRISSRFLHPLTLARPLVAMLASLWRREVAAAEGGDGPHVDNSVVDRLCDMAAACPNQYLAALPDALLRHHSGGGASTPPEGEPQLDVLRQQCSVVSTMVENFVVRRAAAGGGGDDGEDDVPADFVDPITMAVMTDPVRLPDSKVVLDRGTIGRHLEEYGTDPYSREPLEVGDIVEMPELRAAIARWRADKAAAAQQAAAAGVSSGGGSAPGAGGGPEGDPHARQRRMDAKVAADTIRSHVPDSWDVDSDEEEAVPEGAAAEDGQQREE